MIQKATKEKNDDPSIAKKRHMGLHGLNSNNNSAIFKTTFMGTE